MQPSVPLFADVSQSSPLPTGLFRWHQSQIARDLLELLDRMNPTIAELTQAIEQEVEKYPEAQRTYHVLTTRPAPVP